MFIQKQSLYVIITHSIELVTILYHYSPLYNDTIKVLSTEHYKHTICNATNSFPHVQYPISVFQSSNHVASGFGF